MRIFTDVIRKIRLSKTSSDYLLVPTPRTLACNFIFEIDFAAWVCTAKINARKEIYPR